MASSYGYEIHKDYSRLRKRIKDKYYRRWQRYCKRLDTSTPIGKFRSRAVKLMFDLEVDLEIERSSNGY